MALSRGAWLGVDVGGTNLVAALLNSGGRMVDAVSFPTDPSPRAVAAGTAAAWRPTPAPTASSPPPAAPACACGPSPTCVVSLALPLPAAVARYAFAGPARRVKITLARDKDHLGVIGAALLARRRD